MRKNVLEFIRRGLTACGFGPLVLAVMYMVLYSCGLVETVSVPELSTGIFSLSALAFVVAKGIWPTVEYELTEPEPEEAPTEESVEEAPAEDPPEEPPADEAEDTPPTQEDLPEAEPVEDTPAPDVEP